MTDEDLLKVYDEAHERRALKRDGLRAVYERGRADGPRWIPVGEHRPPVTQLVVWRLPDGTVTLERCGLLTLPTCETRGEAATHWMPLAKHETNT